MCVAFIALQLATSSDLYLGSSARRRPKSPEVPMHVRPAIAALALLLFVDQAQSADYICKSVGEDWTWFSNHVVGSIDYLIVGPKDRSFRAGTGVFFRGKPWGSTSDGSGTVRMTAWGAGALHIRQQDSGPAFKVCVTSEKLDPLTIIHAEF
jgi:hypothetical protein